MRCHWVEMETLSIQPELAAVATKQRGQKKYLFESNTPSGPIPNFASLSSSSSGVKVI